MLKGKRKTIPAQRTQTVEVVSLRFLTDHAYSIRCQRGTLDFLAGQVANLGFQGAGVNREYSSYSGENDDYIEFLIKEIENGFVSVQLKSLRPGDKVEIDGFYGDFRIRTPDDGRKYCLIGTGTGIAPFRSFVMTYPNLDYQILHGISYANEQYDRQDYAPERYIACVSREGGGDFRGRVTDYLQQNPPDPSAAFYLCGNRAMISQVYELLRKQGVRSDNIVSEAWY